MAQIYIPDETKDELEELANKEHRTMVDEIAFLLENRKNELGILADAKSSSDRNNDTKPRTESQGNKFNGVKR